MLIGVWGSRVLFRTLAENGYADLAFKMITRTDEKSYGYMAARDCNTLWEKILHLPKDMLFTLPKDNKCTSFNHHFWGDVSAWYYTEVCGINYNPYFDGKTDVKISPKYVKGLNLAAAEYNSRKGKIKVKWERSRGKIRLYVEIPEKMNVEYDLNGAELFEKRIKR